ncbi:GntR family transcriptional regulator [Ahrensia kielensis]|uniref:GntR family transcriptional regulator n=1 Tax=Ahrensia kielensis TaxID=76980 RepID=A0ABU9T368_9HYPH|nr:GntR family transcriptional regulator [Ahrensia kielensis]
MTTRRANIIADAIEQEILTRKLADGDRLDEHRLAERFDVSRTPIREALQLLQASGLVEHHPRRGVFVRQPGPIQLLEMFEVMAGLESMCGRLAASRISDAGIEELQKQNTICREAVATQDADMYFAANERFHHTIYAHCGNNFLELETLQLYRRLKPFRRQQLHLRGRLQQSLDEHEGIVEALSKGQTDKAASALLQHVAVQGEKFHRLLALSAIKAAE